MEAAPVSMRVVNCPRAAVIALVEEASAVSNRVVNCPRAAVTPFVDDTLAAVTCPTTVRYPLAYIFVELTAASVVCPAFDWNVPPIVMLSVVETFPAREVVAVTVNAPVEVTTESISVEVPLPPTTPMTTCPSVPFVNPPVVSPAEQSPVADTRF